MNAQREKAFRKYINAENLNNDSIVRADFEAGYDSRQPEIENLKIAHECALSCYKLCKDKLSNYIDIEKFLTDNVPM